MSNNQQLVNWKTSAWHDSEMVAWYSQQMVLNSGVNQLKNLVESEILREAIGDGTIIDIGVGTGRGSLDFAREGRLVTGVDSSQAMLDECRRLAGNTPITLQIGDLAALPFPDGYFDNSISLNVLVHFPHWQAVLAEWKRVVKPRGRIVFDVNSLDHLNVVSGTRQTSKQRVEDTVNAGDFSRFMLALSVDELVDYANMAGLKVVNIVPYGLLAGDSARIPAGQSGFLKDYYWWRRLLAWFAKDPYLLAFGHFVERMLCSHLDASLTGRIMVVLENSADLSANTAFIERVHAIRNLAGKRISLDDLAPYTGLSALQWRIQFNRLLDSHRAKAVFYHMLLALIDKGLSFDLASFVDERHLCHFIEWAKQDGNDQKTLVFIDSWYKSSDKMSQALQFNGVQLGGGMRYELMRDFLACYFSNMREPGQ